MSSVNELLSILHKGNTVQTDVYGQIDSEDEDETTTYQGDDPHFTYMIYVVGTPLTIQQSDVLVGQTTGKQYQLVSDGLPTGPNYYELKCEVYRGN